MRAWPIISTRTRMSEFLTMLYLTLRYKCCSTQEGLVNNVYTGFTICFPAAFLVLVSAFRPAPHRDVATVTQMCFTVCCHIIRNLETMHD